jgi:heme exporter protein D
MLRSRKGSRGFLFWLAVGIGIAGVLIIVHSLLSPGAAWVETAHP